MWFLKESSESKERVRLSKSLSEGEVKYVQERMVIVEKCLKDHGIKCGSNNVPRIAVLGSGGGQRAMVGLLGCLDQMYHAKLLDCALYLCGVSGSTWCMTSMYEDPAWSTKVPSIIESLVKRLTETDIDLSELTNWLSQAIEDENFSLTDFWAATVVYGFVKKINTTCLSDLKNMKPTNPYPIYTVNDQGLKDKGDKVACWFELSPHEVGYSHLGAYVDTSTCRSQFEGGVLKQRTSERDMLYLQGLCGSALADGEENVNHIKNSIWQWLKEIYKSGSEQKAKDSAEKTKKQKGKPKGKGKGKEMEKGKENEKKKGTDKEKVIEKGKEKEKEKGTDKEKGTEKGKEKEKEKEKEEKEGGSFFGHLLGYDDEEKEKKEEKEEGGSFFGRILGYGNEEKEEEKEEKKEESKAEEKGGFFSRILGYGDDEKEDKEEDKKEEDDDDEKGGFFSRILGYGHDKEEDKKEEEDDDDEEGGSFFSTITGTIYDYVHLDDMASETVESILHLFDCDDEEESAQHVQKIHKNMSGVDSEHAKKPEKNMAGKSKEEKHESLAEYAVDAFSAFQNFLPGLSNVTKIKMNKHPQAGRAAVPHRKACVCVTLETKVPDDMLSDERSYLEDAGLVLNSPYVAALRPERNVKLILSFDFSAGDPFMTVVQAAEHCKHTGIPFPPVEVPDEDRKHPKDFYVFKSENTPTVIHIPLFNMVNCKGDVDKWRETYPTFRPAYDRETMEELIRVSGLNVINNKEKIFKEIAALCK
ncbi:ankyrin repeat domain-containing protein 12-like [Anguilla rostrata]